MITGYMDHWDCTDYPAYLLEVIDAAAFLNKQDVTFSLRDFDAVKKFDALLLLTWPDIPIRLTSVEVSHTGKYNIVQYCFKPRDPGNDIFLSSALYYFRPELVQEDV